MEAKKTDMANSEKLFGLDFTLYPELVEVAKDLEMMVWTWNKATYLIFMYME